MKKLLSIILIFSLFVASATATQTTKKSAKKKGIISKMKDSAVRGFGYGVGREAAKETVKGAKKAANSETAQKIKDKTVETAKKLTGKDDKK